MGNQGQKLGGFAQLLLLAALVAILVAVSSAAQELGQRGDFEESLDGYLDNAGKLEAPLPLGKAYRVATNGRSPTNSWPWQDRVALELTGRALVQSGMFGLVPNWPVGLRTKRLQAVLERLSSGGQPNKGTPRFG